ncbi:MIP/aquaporin family protein [Kordiimonas sp. SCSIO 12610]|uniref:MIP/aquaporin family protein n=1 Tax=Kordiimonas sp. SCSIO 12610 TaxID=2829597 RepID=UPI00210F1D50|nr:MIP/aquaporin family protein [Kordiimonas sp. SCSIO 12610]UTW55010.1 aquaporin family protein [Kordiimonas sp. SCSIO 12610]
MKRQLLAEFIGTMLLLATVVGSGIMGETLAGGNSAIALLGNTIATGAILVVLILIFGPISGAHFNPAVSLVFFLKGELTRQEFPSYMAVQFFGAIAGVFLAHLMFDISVIQASTNARTGMGQWVSEAVATFGLLATILGCVKFRTDVVPYAVGLYITAGYWFTASTSFANPAVTFARSFTDTFSGIMREDVPLFIIAQLLGALIAFGVFKILLEEDGTDEAGAPMAEAPENIV